jgi:diacylglycerol O-acyltransferase / wax synthase
MVVLISRGGWCTITARYDRASVRNEALFAQCLVEGFDEILALAGDPAPHAVPASFTAEPAGSASRSVSGS